LGISLFLLSFLSYTFSAKSGWQSQLFTHLALAEHLKDFARGVVDTRPVVLYLSLTVYFLFLTLKVVESRRWR
jgi:ABC-2 type transport system permease protein